MGTMGRWFTNLKYPSSPSRPRLGSRFASIKNIDVLVHEQTVGQTSGVEHGDGGFRVVLLTASINILPQHADYASADGCSMESQGYPDSYAYIVGSRPYCRCRLQSIVALFSIWDGMHPGWVICSLNLGVSKQYSDGSDFKKTKMLCC